MSAAATGRAPEAARWQGTRVKQEEAWPGEEEVGSGAQRTPQATGRFSSFPCLPSRQQPEDSAHAARPSHPPPAPVGSHSLSAHLSVKQRPAHFVQVCAHERQALDRLAQVDERRADDGEQRVEAAKLLKVGREGVQRRRRCEADFKRMSGQGNRCKSSRIEPRDVRPVLCIGLVACVWVHSLTMPAAPHPPPFPLCLTCTSTVFMLL